MAATLLVGRPPARLLCPVLRGIVLALLIAFTATPALDAWDGDGGFDADYSKIPRLTWTGPGAPGTGADYLRVHPYGPLTVTPVYATAGASAAGRIEKALVLVNATLLGSVQTELDLYVDDLEADGYTVEVHAISGGTPQTLKAFILLHSQDLKGCVFVGDLPVAWFEMEIWGHEEFPCDLYYMDLDGIWNDQDGDGLFDEFIAGSGDEGPEIFIGHMDTSMMSGNEAQLLKEYLAKNHDFRTGAFAPPNHALSYTEQDWASYMDMRTDIKYAYPSFDDVPHPNTNRDDYVDNRIQDNGYEFIQLCCHSSPFAHYFTVGGQAWNSEVKAAEPFAMFYNLFCCSTLRFTETDFLGGSYIYDTSDTSVAVIGSTKTGSMLSFHAFYKPFGQDQTFGESFRQWFNYLAPFDNDERAWHFGMTIAGDPFLKRIEPALVLELPGGAPGPYLPPGPEVPVTLKVNNANQVYLPGTATVSYRYQPGAAFTTMNLTDLGGGLCEGTLPGPVPGDAPEFYFSARTTGGDLVNLPAQAPAETYAFEVAFVEPFFADDFETDKGWTVTNINLTDGAWDRGVPVGGGDRGDPPTDQDGSGKCFLTDNEDGNSDVDGGPTRLTSPKIDLSKGDALVSYWRWHYCDDNDDLFTVEVSNDDGATWHTVEQAQHEPSWTYHDFMVSDYLTPTDAMRFRFNAVDDPNNSVTEAGLDAFKVRHLLKDPSLWADRYAMSVAVGGQVDFFLDATAAQAGRGYLLLGSASGTTPGFKLPGGLEVPLNWDLFTNLIVGNLGTGIFQQFLGTLDGSGRATARFDTFGPLGGNAAGLTLTFRFILGPPPGYDYLSNPVPLDLTP